MISSTGTPPSVAGLVLAAGAGRRLGGRPKALLDLAGRPLVERAAQVLGAGGCAPVHVVLGAAEAEVRKRADLAGCELVSNPDWATGMASSLRAGLASLSPGTATAALIMLVDQPRIGAEAVARLVRAHGDGAALAAAAYGGERGNPVLIARHHWAAVRETATGDRGARDFLRDHRAELTLVECGDVAAPDDIDTEADLRLLGPYGD
ncbi:nucleotidyltransferase family protein [Streptomyces sp. A7024]|uniref:Nucleotidyltransferase family protein n=1 Tax=Streptomyces coryli TaxID=1128680 RepID=A0A6G4U786_9ACTN|nr:nucleotidyltransferase family protein [Streptomyces coryli]NGN68105.1 nucleotidyltransferase family protein [Streptomyces coryli]